MSRGVVRTETGRFRRRRWTRRWGTWRRILAALVTVGAVTAGVWLVFFSAVLAVSGVEISGTDVVSREEVGRVAAVPLGEPLATVDLDAVADRLDALPAVEHAEVSRAWPDRVRVALTEREAVAVVEQDGVVRGFDDSGVLFRSYPALPKDLPLVRMGKRTGQDALAEVGHAVSLLPRDLAARVAHVEVETPDSITLQLRDGRTVEWGSGEQSQTKAEVLTVLLEQKGSVYDVSVPGQPTLRR